MSLQTNISGSNSRTFGHVCIDANRHFTSTESQSCVCFWCLFAFFCVGQVESSASWQAADPLLGQCLELIVTVRHRSIPFQDLFCRSEVFIAVEKAIMSYYDLSYRYKYEVPQIWIFWICLDLQRRLVAVTCSCDGPLWSDSSNRRSPRGRVS